MTVDERYLRKALELARAGVGLASPNPVVGAVVGISLIVFRGRDRNVPIPFGPYLAGAGWITLIWGEALHAAAHI